MQGLLLVGKLLELCEHRKKKFTIDSNDFNALKIKIFFVADPCHHYLNLSEVNRNTNHQTPPSEPTLCDSRLPKGWYRFVGDAGKKNANNTCTKRQMWYSQVRVVRDCSSFSGRW